MTTLGCILTGLFLFALVVTALGVAACMLSSQISEREERQRSE